MFWAEASWKYVHCNSAAAGWLFFTVSIIYIVKEISPDYIL